MQTFTLPASAVRSAQACQSTKDIRYYMCGIALLPDGRIVGTDGHVLAIFTPDKPITRAETTIVAIKGKIPASSLSVTIDLDRGLVTTDNGKAFTCETIDGRYPDIDRVLPTIPRPKTCNGLAIDPALVAKVGAVFKAGQAVEFYFGSHSEAVLCRQFTADGVQSMLIMPKRHDSASFIDIDVPGDKDV